MAGPAPSGIIRDRRIKAGSTSGCIRGRQLALLNKNLNTPGAPG